MNVITLTADEVAALSADALQARGLPPAAVAWILGHRDVGAIRFDRQTQTVTPLSVLEEQ